MRRWPGYTLSSLEEEDAYLLYQTLGLLDDELGKAE